MQRKLSVTLGGLMMLAGVLGMTMSSAGAPRKVLVVAVPTEPGHLDPSEHMAIQHDFNYHIVDILRDVDADLSRTIIGHIERTILERSDMGKLAETGCVLEFDLFGREHSYYKHSPDIDMINDAVRLKLIAWLIAEGHGRQLVLAHDTAQKSHLVRYGGCGYAHILQNIVPRMRARGFKEADIQTMLVETPRRLLTFAPPRD